MNIKTKFLSISFILAIMLTALTTSCKKNENKESICLSRNWTNKNGYTDWNVAKISDCSCVPCDAVSTNHIVYDQHGKPSSYSEYKWENCNYISNSPPNPPVLISPTNNSFGTVSDTLNWSCSDPEGNILVYDVYFGKNNPPSKISSDYYTTVFVPKDIEKNAIYYWRIVAKDCYGAESSSSIWSFTASYRIPILTTANINNVTTNSAECGGNVTFDNGLTILEKGVCWSSLGTPTIDDNKTTNGPGIGLFTSSLTGLTPKTYYYVRAYATNFDGTAYGNVINFTTIADIVFNPDLEYNEVTDIDGNTYKTIIIGSQTWMAENLKTTHYQNGEEIPNVTNNSEWMGLSYGAYCWYLNDFVNKTTYGALYNWYAAINNSNVCPIGWHIPSYDEWETLITYVGGSDVAGGKLKETGTAHWQYANPGTTNESGFTALPGGERVLSGSNGFVAISEFGFYWSSTPNTANDAKKFSFRFDDNNILYGWGEHTAGYSIRCTKD